MAEMGFHMFLSKAPALKHKIGYKMPNVLLHAFNILK